MSNADTKRARLESVVARQLDLAEEAWRECGSQLMVKADSLRAFAEAMETEIPGHATIEENEFIVDEFIACVVDMRDSSRHLLCEISPRRARVSMLQRVFFEVSALLPMAADLLYEEGGRVTEYLGDGLLGLIKVEDDGRAACYAAWHVGRDIIGMGRDVVNAALHERYDLPPIDVGVGLAVSKAIVSGFGHPRFRQAKAIGECVYRATKLSGERNKVVADKCLEGMWPESEGGRLRFSARHVGDVEGYVITQTS